DARVQVLGTVPDVAVPGAAGGSLPAAAPGVNERYGGPMMSARLLPRLLLTAVLLLPTAALAQLRFQEGRHYNVVPTPQATGLAPAGKIEVTEVFSYICRGCYEAQGLVDEIKAKLPADAVLTYVH